MQIAAVDDNIGHALFRAGLFFLPFEKKELGLNSALTFIPPRRWRRGGTYTISEWGYTTGLMQAVMHFAVGQRDRLDVLDVGCGTGRLAISALPLLGEKGRYVGIDVNANDIERARSNFSDPRLSFIHLDYRNRAYASQQNNTTAPYEVEDSSFDLVTALSVWTHLGEHDAMFYMNEVARVLRPSGKALITFFLLDEDYERFQKSVPAKSAYSLRDPAKWTFNTPVDTSTNWFCPEWTADVPERAIGVTTDGLTSLAKHARLNIESIHPGFWKERPGLFFQDVAMFGK